MNSRIQEVYQENLRIANSIVGLKIQSAAEEQYFFMGQLDKTSRGTLKLELSNGDEIVFNCDVDATSITIREGGFADKGTLASDFADGRYQWQEKEFLSQSDLSNLGPITSTEIETLDWEQQIIQCGCRLHFQSGKSLKIWTVASDKIFYELQHPRLGV